MILLLNVTASCKRKAQATTLTKLFDYTLVTEQSYLVGVHDAEGFLELLDGALGEHGENIAAALLGFPAND